MIYYYLYYFIVFIFGFSIFTYFIISLVDSVLMISLWTLFFFRFHHYFFIFYFDLILTLMKRLD